MSDYTDFWKSLDLPVDQSPKTQAFNTVAANADKLGLTDAEQYSLGWGVDAVPEDWVKARAKEINDEIQGAKSTAILRGDKTLAEMTPEEAAEEIEKVQTELGIGSSGGGSGNGGVNTSSSSPDNSIASNDAISAAFAINDNAKLISAVTNPLVGALAKYGSGAFLDNASTNMGISSDKMNAQTALGSMADTGVGIKSDKTGTVSTYSNPTTIAAQDKAVNDSIDADNAAMAAADRAGWGSSGSLAAAANAAPGDALGNLMGNTNSFGTGSSSGGISNGAGGDRSSTDSSGRGTNSDGNDGW